MHQQSGQQVLLTKFAQHGARKSGFYCSASTFFAKTIDLSQGFSAFPTTTFSHNTRFPSVFGHFLSQLRHQTPVTYQALLPCL